MPDFYEEIKNWTQGVVASIDEDHGPIEALTYGQNTYVSRIGGATGSLATRPALLLSTSFKPTTQACPTNLVHLQPYSYAENDNVTYTQYVAAIAADGSLWYKGQDDSWTGDVLTQPSGATCLQPANTTHIDSAVMNNRLFITALNGERRSLKGKTYEPFGIEAPTITATAQTKTFTSYATQLPADTYDVYATFYNARTGAEGNPSGAVTVTTTSGQVIEVGITYTSAQLAAYGSWKVYARRQSTQAIAYLISPMLDTNGNVFDGELVLSSTTYYINLSASEWANLIVPMPSATENNPPPDDMIYVATYGRRLIGASKRKIYWSKLDKPDNFPPLNYEGIDTGEGDEIMGIYPLRDELLVIFTKSATFVLEGNDPQYWVLKPIDATVGCVGHKSVVEFESQLAWWSPQHGPVLLNGSQIDKIGLERLGRDVWTYGPELDTRIRAGWDPYYAHIVWALPQQDDGAVLSQLLPYNYRINAWVATVWDPIPIGDMKVAYNQRNEQRLFVADRTCRLGYFDANATLDMIPSGTTSGTFTAGASSIGTITDGSATFYTEVVSGFSTLDLRDRSVTITTTNDEFVAREWIGSNTATVLTLRRNVNVTSGTTYRYYIGSPIVLAMTRWMTGEQPFLRKRWDRLYLHMTSLNTSVPIRVSYQKNFNSMSTTNIGTSAVTAQTASLDATWDVPVITTMGMKIDRKAMFVNGQALRIVISQMQPVPFVLVKLSLMGRTLSDRYYQ